MQKDKAPGADQQFMEFWRRDHRPTINNILAISNVVVHYIWKAGQRSAQVKLDEGNQRESFEAFVRSGASPVPPSEVEKPLPDGSYRTSGANNAWAFWQAAQANLVNQSKR